MFLKSITITCCFILGSIFVTPTGTPFAAVYEEHVNQDVAAKFEARVDLDTAAKVTTSHGAVLYEIGYSYEFKKLATVYVKGLGLVPAKGKFVYLTDNPQIEFFDRAYGRMIASSPTPAAYTSLNPIELANEGDFSQAGRDELWQKPTAFQEKAMQVLSKKRFLYQAYEREKIFYLRTTYESLGEVPKNLHAKIALLLSHPHRVENGKFWFRIQYAARERPLKEDKWTDTLCEPVKNASLKFVEEFVKDLMDGK